MMVGEATGIDSGGAEARDHLTARRSIVRALRIGLAAGLVFTAGGWVIRLIDQDVIVTGGADHAVNRFAELLVPCVGGMFLARLLATDRHSLRSLTASTSAKM
jgi:hypothetical protein